MPISKRLASASQADKNNVNAHSGIKAMLESVTHLLFFTHTPPLMFILFMDKANEHQRWSERLERGLSGDFLKAEGWSITSTFSNSTGLSPTWLVFLLFQKRTKKRTDSRFNWETSHVQSEGFASLLLEIPCHFFSLFHQRISSLLSNSPPTVFHCHCSLWEDCEQLSLSPLQYTSACMHCMPPSSPPWAGRKIKMPCCR